MLLPCAPLDPLLLWRVLASIVVPPLRGTSVVVVPVLPLLLLGMLLFGLASLMPTLLLIGVVLPVAVLFVLGTGRCSDSENQGQDGRAGNCDHFHVCSLRCC